MKNHIGKVTTKLIDDVANSLWEEGYKTLVVHSAGGEKSEGYNCDSNLVVVAGHFAYVYASVVQDKLTKELKFDIDYIQVYGVTMGLGTISGAVKQQCFVGSLHLGYLGLRPVSDCLVKIMKIIS